MREAEVKGERLALESGLEADALDFERLLEAFIRALDKIGEERTGQAVKGLVLAGFTFFLYEQGLAVEACLDATGQGVLELAARSLDINEGALHGDFDLVGNDNGFLSNTRHTFFLSKPSAVIRRRGFVSWPDGRP